MTKMDLNSPNTQLTTTSSAMATRMTAYERGEYVRNSSPTGYAPVTSQVREFDWGEKVQPAVTVANAVATAYFEQRAQFNQFVWDNLGTIFVGGVVTAAIVTGLTVSSPALAVGGAVVGLLALLDNNDKGDL